MQLFFPRFWLWPALMLVVQSGFAQIKGRVLDTQQEPVAYANVLLLHAADSTLASGQITSETGDFSMDMPSPGRYFLKVVMLGYADASSNLIEIRQSGQSLNPFVLQMQAQATQLTTVELVGRRPLLEQKTDRLVVNVAQSITYSGGTALEVLQRSPGVRVNRQTQRISLAGKEGVVVMVNGKPSRIPDDALLQMLESISANSIESIEIIHTPPANFEAEGNAGLINIILKEQVKGDVKGVNGNYSVNAGYGKREKAGVGLLLNYRDAKVNVYGRYDANFDVNPQLFSNYRSVNINGKTEETDMTSHRPGLRTSVQNVRLGADWQLSLKTNLSVLGTFFDRDRIVDAVNDVAYTTNDILTERLRVNISEVNNYRSYTGNINLQHQFSDTHRLSLDADYVIYNIDRPGYYLNQTFDLNQNLIKESEMRIAMQTPIRATVYKADWERKFSKTLKWEAGAKLSQVRFDNQTFVEQRMTSASNWLPLADLSSSSRFSENILGAYTSFNIQPAPKTEIKAGLRYEYTATQLGTPGQPKIVDRSFGQWFPSLFVSRKFDDTRQINASYSRRISRPRFAWIAPWIMFNDPTTFQRGNPALLPSITDAWKVSYTMLHFQFGISYSNEANALRPVSQVDAEKNEQYNTYDNLDYFTSLGLDASAHFNPTKWWDMQYNLGLFYQTTDFSIEGQDLQLRNTGFTFSGSQTFSLPRKFRLEISGNYDAPHYASIAFWKATGSLNVGIQKDLGNHWGRLRLSVLDIFQSANWYGLTNQPEVNLYVRTGFGFAERTLMLTWSNDFGNKNLKTARKRQAGAEEELQRLRQ